MLLFYHILLLLENKSFVNGFLLFKDSIDRVYLHGNQCSIFGLKNANVL